jgi:hypothetical protein
MSFKQKLIAEIKAIVITTFYFGCWIAGLLLLKSLILAEYQISFHGWSVLVVGALVLAKVVLVLEHVPLGEWVRVRPAWVEVILRTALYSLGVAVVIVLEKGVEGRHEHGSFGLALRYLFQHEDIHHVLASVLCMSGSLLVYNALTVVKRHLGEGGVIQVFLLPFPEDTKVKISEKHLNC